MGGRKRRYVALTGCRNFFDPRMLRPGFVLKLVKEPENMFDEEAIRVELEPFGKIGYVANSIHTVPKGCSSAGRIYDFFDNSCYAIVRFVVGETAILQLVKGYRMQIEVVDDSFTQSFTQKDTSLDLRKFEQKVGLKEGGYSKGKECGDVTEREYSA